MNQEKLSFGKLMSLSMMLFAMFFGAGNMIFPSGLGQLSGENFFVGTLGFVVTDAGLSVLGIAAIVMLGTKLDDLAYLVSPKFALFMGMVIYLLIGPLFAIPRTAATSFSMAVVPFLPQDADHRIFLLVFSALFFIVTYFISLNPAKLVKIVGSILTPILLISIAVIFVVSLINPVGEIGVAQTAEYEKIPFFKGMIEGYLALDGLAALAFAIVVIDSVKNFGVEQPKNIAKYTLYAGAFSGIGMGIVYLALGYVGAQTSKMETFPSGADLLNYAVHELLGGYGNLVLGIAVLMACLTTAIGLATSFADYFHTNFPKFSYKAILIAVCVFGFAIANVGLASLIQITVPALVMVYPPAIALVLLSFLKRYIGDKHEPYALAVAFSFISGIFFALNMIGIKLGTVTTVAESVPLFDKGLGWVIPAIVGCGIGMLPFVKFIKKENQQIEG
ncbi:MAG: branched-chain amino acid transport system II carrier protein [Eubacteriales bacterium]